MFSGGNLTRSALYLQVSDAMAQRIAGGTWPPGSAIPNEGDLAREFGVSLGTMRKALDKLEAERFVERRQGRGTFVLNHSSDALAFRFSRVVDEEGRRVGDRCATLISQEIALATRAEQESLRLGIHEAVLRTHRLRKHNGRPCKHETASLAKDRLGIENPKTVGDYSIVPLAQACGVHLARATEKISATQASPKVAELLEIDTNKPILKLERLIYSAASEPVEWRISLCNLQDEFYLASMA